MSSPGPGESHAQKRARLEQAGADVLRDVLDDEDDEAALRNASWLTEWHRQAMITSGALRATLAFRIRAARKLSFARLGLLMGVKRARAAEIVANGGTPPKRRKRGASRDA